MAFRFGFRAVLLGIAGLLGTSLFAVELPAIRLDTVFPPGGKAGSEVKVAITGSDLEEVDGLHFSHPGITATHPKAGNDFTVTIAADVPPGIYDARVIGLSGISNPRAFAIGNLPEIAKAKANTKPEDAEALPIDTWISGSVTAGVNDYFKFDAKKGQRLLVECVAEEIDSRLSPVLTVLDAAGQELQVSRKGGLLDFTAPADGGYQLRLSDLSFAGGPDYFYQLSIRTGPHIDCVFPLSGQRGVKSKFTLYGRNLPGGVPANLEATDGKPLEKLELEIEAPAKEDARSDGLTTLSAAAVDGFSYRLKAPQGVSNPVFIGFSGAPGIAEEKTDTQPAQAQKITPPCEIDGQFFPPNKEHAFTFDAKKGEVWWIEVVSHRLGMLTDPAVVVKHGEQEVATALSPDVNPVGKRFNLATNDPECRLEVKEDGAYRVTVEDLFSTGASSPAKSEDPRKAYRLSIRKESPDFWLAAVVEPPPEKKDDRAAMPNAALLLGSGTTAIRVYAFRRDNFAGDIELTAEGLPPGVTSAPAKILAGKSEGWLLLTAVEKPERWAGSIRIIGKAKVGETELVHEARGGVIKWFAVDFGQAPVHTRLTRDVALAVSAKESAPVTVEAAENKVWEVPVGGKLEIPLKITRRAEFDGLKLKCFGAPGVETFKDLDVPVSVPTVTATVDLASVKIPAGEHTIYFASETKGKFRGKAVSTTVYSTPIRITVKAAEPKPPESKAPEPKPK